MTAPTRVTPIDEPQAMTPIEVVPCPLCGADVPDEVPRCPNCGYALAHSLAYASGSDDAPQWLVEVSRLPWLASWNTSLRGLWPWTFWQTVQPRHTPVVRRLVGYGLGATAWTGGLLTICCAVVLTIDTHYRSNRGWFGGQLG
ncbi:MAG: zinc ribbon domain-containing protein, partial [Planctomycetota bacterium]